MPETWKEMRLRMQTMARGMVYEGVMLDVDRAAIREALRRADALTAAENARENVSSGTTNRTAPDAPTFDEVRQAFQDSHDANYDPDSPDWRRRIKRIPVASGNRYELDGRHWNTCARCESCDEFGCFAVSELCPDCEERARLLKQPIRTEAPRAEQDGFTRHEYADGAVLYTRPIGDAPGLPRPDLYDLLAGWALDRDDPRTLWTLLRALVDRAAREGGR